MMRQAKAAFLMVFWMTLLCGVLYPLAVTGIAQGIFPRQANGSLVAEGGRPAGSALIGQPFSSPRYFWGRPSATPGRPCNAALSGGSNLGPTNPELRRLVADRIRVLRDADPGNAAPVPVDLVTASGSGLDPDISPAAALYQVPRVARARGLSRERVRDLVGRHTEGRLLGIFGEPRVNVLALNLDLDRTSRAPSPVP